MIYRAKFRPFFATLLMLTIVLSCSFLLVLKTQALSKNSSCVVESEIVLEQTNTTNLTQSCELEGFDSSLGILESVAVSLKSEITSKAGLENLQHQSGLAQAEWSVASTLSSNSDDIIGKSIDNFSNNKTENSDNTIAHTQSPFGVLEILPAFDGSLDFAGTSGKSFAAISTNQTDSTLVTNPDLVQNFHHPKDSKNVSFPVQIEAQLFNPVDYISAKNIFKVVTIVEVSYMYNLPDIGLILETARTATRDSIIDVSLKIINYGQQPLNASYEAFFDVSEPASVVITQGQESGLSGSTYGDQPPLSPIFEINALSDREFIIKPIFNQTDDKGSPMLKHLQTITIPLRIIFNHGPQRKQNEGSVLDKTETYEYIVLKGQLKYNGVEASKHNNYDWKEITLNQDYLDRENSSNPTNIQLDNALPTNKDFIINSSLLLSFYDKQPENSALWYFGLSNPAAGQVGLVNTVGEFESLQSIKSKNTSQTAFSNTLNITDILTPSSAIWVFRPNPNYAGNVEIKYGVASDLNKVDFSNSHVENHSLYLTLNPNLNSELNPILNNEINATTSTEQSYPNQLVTFSIITSPRESDTFARLDTGLDYKAPGKKLAKTGAAALNPIVSAKNRSLSNTLVNYPINVTE